MNVRRSLPATLELMPIIQESTWVKSMRRPGAYRCWVHSRCAAGVASTRVWPRSRIHPSSAVTQSTFCSMQRGMLQNVAALCGPTSVKRFGEPSICHPRYLRGAPAPLARPRRATPPADVDAIERAGDRVEAGRVDDHVGVIVCVARLHAGG